MGEKCNFLKSGDIILDPFFGSGTTMVQASELGMHAIGIDISAFNSMIANCKVGRYDLPFVKNELNKITTSLKDFLKNSHTIEFEEELLKKLYEFNNQYFPVPDYKYRLRNGQINEKIYGQEKEKEFFDIYNQLIIKYNIKLRVN
ncbi:MAG TPA: DNA methyltransferase [Turneriella sp.]|nr:DNA methyltransferase [Turneriella sp.]